MHSSSLYCERCSGHASQFVYLEGTRLCYNCYNLVERPPDAYPIDTAPASDGLRELREWTGVPRELIAQRLNVPVDSLERFEQNWAAESEKALIRQQLVRLFSHGG
jgi:hypothetical protein